ncbi:hypothetical protein ACHAXN_012970 [Cyclotella atomus]
MNSDDSSSSSAPATHARINEYLISINADPNATLRPTQAQLRWWHFHRAECVRDTRAKVDRLMHYPERVADVKGAYPSDGESSVDDCHVNEPQHVNNDNAVEEQMNKSAYLGMRRDGQGRWVRRRFSQKRFPHLAKSVPSSPSRRSPFAANFSVANEQSANSCNKRFKHKVEISKGRKALLRVSARAYEERKRRISTLDSAHMQQRLAPQHVMPKVSAHRGAPVTARRSPVPYQFSGELPSLSESYSYNEELAQITSPTSISEQSTHGKSIDEAPTPTKSRKHKRKKKHKVVFENTPESLPTTSLERKISTLQLEDEISGLFTTRTGESSSRISTLRSRRRTPGSSTTSFVSTEEEERIRRFEEAYRAIMMATYTCQDNDEATIVSSEWINSGGKRWSRDPNVSSAISVDGRVYDDLQRGPTLSRRQVLNSPDVVVGNLRCREPLFDRGATWMVHVPRVKPSKVETVEEKDETYSPSRGRGRQCEMNNRNVLLSPCQKKLSDIEQRVHRSVSRPKLDLVQNRKAVAQNHHESHSKMVRQMQQSKSSPSIGVNAISSSSRPPICRLNNMMSTPTNSTPTQSLASKTRESNDNADATPPSTVRTSTLRRLFSGIADTPVQSKGSSSSDSSVVKQARSKVSGMREMFEQSQSNDAKPKRSPRPDPIASIFGNKSRFSTDYSCENSSDQVNSAEISAAPLVDKFDQGRSSPSFLARVREAFEGDDSKQHEDSIHLPSLSASKSQSPDPLDCVDENIPSSMSVTLQNLDVTTLVRQSLSQKESRSVIDTDGTATDITGGYDEEHYMDKMGSLLMSPALLTKRYLQALEAIELRNWEQVSYLINADPWLMEMKDLRNDQYLVHVLALFGAGQHDGEDDASQPAPRELIEAMLEHDPSVTHKLDNEGNLPLHMAAASGNIAMIHELGLRFPSAASVQNHDGLLPLHLAIMSCALFPTGEQAVSLILALFHGGVCVKDNVGNMPLHTAARTLKGDVGVDIIYQLMAVCNKLAHDNPAHVRESIGGNVKKPKQLFDDTGTMITTTTDPFTDASGLEDSFPISLFCLAKNNSGDTPLTRAIKSLAGWQVIEALLSMTGGHMAVLEKNSGAQTALHLALEIDFNDASAVLAILKAAPSAAPIPDGSGVLPIELACMNCLQREIILALAIIDLPIDLGARQEAILRNGFGASWWFLVCESSDHYVDIVAEILSMCSHPQKTALCLTRAIHYDSNKTVISCATPQCKLALVGSLRFLGRFEFTGGENRNNFAPERTQQFNATDFGTHEHPFDGGRKVSLRCYMNDVEYIKETRHLNGISLPWNLFEDLEFFSIDQNEPNAPHDIRVKHCASVSMPSISLARVVAGMPKDHKYRRDANALSRYFGKVKHVLYQTAKGLSHLHEIGIVHGSVDSHHIGKFNDGWKLTGLLDSFKHGSRLPSREVGLHCPPEAFLSEAPTALPSLDVWSFGKLMYEVFVGQCLFTPFQEEGQEHIILLSWNERHQAIIFDELVEARIGSIGIDLITRCLCSRVQDRLSSMVHVVQHPFWHDANPFNIY